MLTFALLDKQRMRVDELPAYLDRIGIYRDFNELFFRVPADELADRLVGELERAGAVRREDGWLRPR